MQTKKKEMKVKQDLDWVALKQAEVIDDKNNRFSSS